jgi:DNA repair protein RadC
MSSKVIDTFTVHERLEQLGPRALLDEELVAMVLGPTAGANSVREAALRLLDEKPLIEMAWSSPDELQQAAGIGRVRAAALVAAFELGRRGTWAVPKRGERLQEPARVHELLRHLAHAEREEFHVVLLDVRCRLLKTVRVSEGSLTQCPVAPRDVLREALRAGAHGVIFVHNHPSGDPGPSAEDYDLTQRLRAASELVGVTARDHIIVATGGYYSFVEAGRWRR